MTRRDGRPRFVLRQRSFGAVWALIDYRDRARRPFDDTADSADEVAELEDFDEGDVVAAA